MVGQPGRAVTSSLALTVNSAAMNVSLLKGPSRESGSKLIVVISRVTTLAQPAPASAPALLVHSSSISLLVHI